MMPLQAPELSRWVQQVRQGDDRSAAELWECCIPEMIRLARRSLGKGDPALDPEDVALSAFHDACHGLAGGRFDRYEHRGEFWALLSTLVRRKVTRHRRAHGAQKRGGGAGRFEVSVDEVSDERCDPADLAVGALAIQELLTDLPHPFLREVALWKLDGYKVRDIARLSGLSPVTIKRKLALIREYWTSYQE